MSRRHGISWIENQMPKKPKPIPVSPKLIESRDTLYVPGVAVEQPPLAEAWDLLVQYAKAMPPMSVTIVIRRL
jgi:hypothetical protein